MDNGRYVIVGLGELLWDLFPQGRKMGGAPANFAFHSAALGDTGIVASRVGDDRLGLDILTELRGLGLDDAWVQRDERRATGTVNVELDVRGQPHYTITEDVAWDHLAWTDAWQALAERADAVCFGSLAQRHPASRATIRQFLQAVRRDRTLRVFDVNLRQAFYSPDVLDSSLRMADIVKLNEDELPRVLQELGKAVEGPVSADARSLIGAYGLRMACVTRGERGSVLVTPDRVSEHRGYSVELIDPVGAGDAFTAALVHHYLRGGSLDRMSDAANRLGAWVAGREGATPAPEEEVVAEVVRG